MSSLTLFIKPTAGGDKLSVELARESSVEQLKQAIQERHGVPAQEQRLIYKGVWISLDRLCHVRRCADCVLVLQARC